MTDKATANKPTEKGGASGAAKALALLLALLLVLTIPLALLAFDLWRVVFNPTLVKSLITDEALNSDLIPIGLEWFSDVRAQQREASGESLSGIDEPDVVLLMSFLDREDWRAIKNEVLTDELLTHLVSVTVDGTYGWIDSTDRVPQITWDLASFIDRVNGEHGVNAIVVAYDTLPPCTQEEIENFLYRLGSVPPGVEVLYNLCEFPNEWQGRTTNWHDDQLDDYQRSLFKVVANIPKEFALTDTLAQTADKAGVGPEALKQQLRLIRLLALWAWLLPAVLVLLVAVLVVRSLRGVARWIGVPLIVGGFLALLPTLVYRWLITSVLAAGALSEIPDAITQEATRVILRLASEVFTPMLIQAVVLMAVGIGLAVWAALQNRKAAASAAG